MSVANLRWFYDQADERDRAEGLLAYARYQCVMREIADHYGFPLDRTVAAFVALSPNNSYFSNLRSLVSVLVGINEGAPCCDITVSTYKRCRDRAFNYATGIEQFVAPERGLKTLSFYHNIVEPDCRKHVTVDGHISAAWQGQQRLTMKQALVRRRKDYAVISDDIKIIAAEEGLIPNQVQATIWFARKRLLGIVYNAQGDLFYGADDVWQTSVPVARITPYNPAAPFKTSTRTYNSWNNMIQRCRNPKSPKFKWYGARGVEVCERWLVFENFLADMGERPDDMTLDREDVAGHYEPGNCRWADPITQANNRRCHLPEAVIPASDDAYLRDTF